MAWVAAGNVADIPTRKLLLPVLAGRCVRLQQMQLSELELLDQRPEVLACEASTRVVAGMYLSMIMETTTVLYAAAKHARPAYAKQHVAR